LVATTNVEMPTKSASERSTREELMMNVVSSLSNISYYGGNSILEHGKDISRILVRLLTLGVSGSSSGTVQESKTNHTSSTGMDEFHGWLSLECARVYGNFSRTDELRTCMRSTGADVAMVMLMEHDDRDLVHSSCGVLVNLAITPSGKRLLLRDRGEGLRTILSVVKDAGTKDIGLSTLACRALYNVYMTGSIEGGNGSEEISDDDIDALSRERDRLRPTVCAALDELEDVVSDMVEDMEEEEDEEDEEELCMCRDFLDVVRPMLKKLDNEGDGNEMEKEENDMVPLKDCKK